MTGAFPTISLVTPAYNRAHYLDAAMDSVLGQHYPALEYIVVDGGSTDGSTEIIERRAERLAGWSSEPDQGQYDALNKGFARTRGEIMGWLNSDDLHTPWTLRLVAEIFSALPEVRWLTTLFPLTWDARGLPVRCSPRKPFSRERFLRGGNLPGCGWISDGWIQQESTFWRRSLWNDVGGYIDPSFRAAGDFDLWVRFFAHAELVGVEAPIAGFRRHGEQKTETILDTYKAEAREALRRGGGAPPRRSTAAFREAVERVTPRRVASALSKVGIFTQGPVCAFDFHRGGWRINGR